MRIGNSIDLALENGFTLNLNPIEWRDRVFYTFPNNDDSYKFEENVFDLFETFAVSLREYLFKKLSITRVFSIANSDVHGDPFLSTLPYFISGQISKLRYDERSGYLSFSFLKNSTKCINCGSIVETIPSKATSRVTRDFFIRMTVSLIDSLDSVFIIGNHDGRLINFDYSIFRNSKLELNNEWLFDKLYILH